MEKKIDYPSERINVNKIESRIKTRYYLKLLTVKMLKLFASSKSKTAKYKTDENVPYLEINEALLVQCIILIIQDFCIHLFIINHLVNY